MAHLYSLEVVKSTILIQSTPQNTDLILNNKQLKPEYLDY